MKGEKILKKLQKLSSLQYILASVVVVSLGVMVYAYLTAQVLLLNSSLSVLGIFVMMLVACWTLGVMDASTRDTVQTMLETSGKNIYKFDEMIENLWVSNERLGEVSKSLKVMSDEIITKQQMRPQLLVTFVKGQKEISINAGVEKDIELLLRNIGKLMADQPEWKVFFPHDIEVITSGRGNKMPQGSFAHYPNYMGIDFKRETMVGKTYISETIKLKISSKSVGKLEIPYKCTCKDVPSNEGILIINAIC